MALNLVVLPILALRFGRFEPAFDEFSSDPMGRMRDGSDGIRLPAREAQLTLSLTPPPAASSPAIQPHEEQSPVETEKPVRTMMRVLSGQSVVARRPVQELWKDSRT
jgi:hypothetical protein